MKFKLYQHPLGAETTPSCSDRLDSVCAREKLFRSISTSAAKAGWWTTLPLLADVGEAPAPYLREDRGVRVWLSFESGVRSALAQAGVRRPVCALPSVSPRINPKTAVANAGVCHSRADAGPASKAVLTPNGESAEQLEDEWMSQETGGKTAGVTYGASMPEIAEVLRHRSQATNAGAPACPRVSVDPRRIHCQSSVASLCAWLPSLVQLPGAVSILNQNTLVWLACSFATPDMVLVLWCKVLCIC
jgi:hypothetical protein